MPHISRWKLKDDDRTGFTKRELSLVKQPPWKVAPEEFDVPPPSKKSLGGEGDVSGSPRPNSDFAAAGTAKFLPVDQIPTTYVTAAGGIVPSFRYPWMQLVGSNGAITLSANPQIARGKQGNVLTLYCVGSSISLSNGNGVALMGSLALRLDSGDTVTFMYQTGGSAWYETSRNRGGGL